MIAWAQPRRAWHASLIEVEACARYLDCKAPGRRAIDASDPSRLLYIASYRDGPRDVAYADTWQVRLLVSHRRAGV
ncbi:hypothetical protein XdyCFBP7245_01320 [Xanthomonas dyei]|uniref:Uncharacterized protein n=1 Tax=Xanthomonas dyei TaxID=743699 RepID=A0A2S7CC73_9XANT|nr:hypothetical protein XdyCFBP7245_01320 [Xanthomonas dyei]